MQKGYEVRDLGPYVLFSLMRLYSVADTIIAP